MMIVSVGFTAGAAFGGFVAAWLIPNFGWRSVFYFGGAVPFVLAILMARWMPESLQFMVLRRRNRAQVDRWLQRIAPSAPVEGAELLVNEESRGGVPVLPPVPRRTGPGGHCSCGPSTSRTYSTCTRCRRGSRPSSNGPGTRRPPPSSLAPRCSPQGRSATFGLAWFIARRGFVPRSGRQLRHREPEPRRHGTIALVDGGADPGRHRLRVVHYRQPTRTQRAVRDLLSDRHAGRPASAGGWASVAWAGSSDRGWEDNCWIKWSPNALFLLAAVPALLSTVIIFGLGRVLPSPSRGQGRRGGLREPTTRKPLVHAAARRRDGTRACRRYCPAGAPPFHPPVRQHPGDDDPRSRGATRLAEPAHAYLPRRDERAGLPSSSGRSKAKAPTDCAGWAGRRT